MGAVMTTLAKITADASSAAEAGRMLGSLNPRDADYLRSEIMPLLPHGQKIPAIKAIRERVGCSLRGAKYVVDALAEGATVASVRRCPVALVESLESIDNCCRTAIRQAVGDEKSQAALAGIRQQVAELWAELIELPRYE